MAASTSFFTSLTTSFGTLLNALLASDLSTPTQSNLGLFGPDHWKTHAPAIDITASELTPPSELVSEGSKKCPFSPEKTVKQTHILCCIPKGLSVEKLYKACGKSTDLLSDKHRVENKKTYWCWVAKEAHFKHLPLASQKSKIEEAHCALATRLEVMTAIFAARKLADVTLYSEQDGAGLCCQNPEGELTDIIGGHSYQDIVTSYAAGHYDYGIASVIRQA